MVIVCHNFLYTNFWYLFLERSVTETLSLKFSQLLSSSSSAPLAALVGLTRCRRSLTQIRNHTEYQFKINSIKFSSITHTHASKACDFF
jgi:hypothetical protein